MRYPKLARFNPWSRLALGVLLPALLLWACSDKSPLEPGDLSPQYAKPGTVDLPPPEVNSTDPSEAPQDTTLSVLINGENFDRGSVVEFGKDDEVEGWISSDKVKASKVKFVNANRLKAQVDVALDAEIAKYDVRVTSSRGKKGIGTERFMVIEKLKINSGDFDLLSFSVRPAGEIVDPSLGSIGVTLNEDVNQAIYAYLDTENPLPRNDAYPGLPLSWGDFLGCPGGLEDCSAIRLVTTPAKPLNFTLGAIAVVGKCGAPDGVPCLLDQDLDNRGYATAGGFKALPAVPWDLVMDIIEPQPDGSQTLTVFWQGQRGDSYVVVEGEEKVRGKWVPNEVGKWFWDLIPDLYSEDVGSPDRFAILPSFQTGPRTYHVPVASRGNLMENCDAPPPGGCLAEFQGGPGLGTVEAEWLEPTYSAGLFSFSVKANTSSPDNPNPESFGRVMLTYPDGSRAMLEQFGISYHRNPETGLAATEYVVEGLDPSKCYRFDLAGLAITEDGGGANLEGVTFDHRFVWEGDTDPIFFGEGCGGN